MATRMEREGQAGGRTLRWWVGAVSSTATILLTTQAALAQGGAAAPAGAPLPSIGVPLPAHDLSPWGMFMGADYVVKAVMIGLALASVVTWTVWLAKSLELVAANRRLRADIGKLEDAGSLREAAQHFNGRRGDVASRLRAALAELSQSNGLPADGIKERIASRFERLDTAANRLMTRGTGVLATIGSTAPFVGLFGTVWGIMNSFVGIAKAQTSNLAVVAPGIAEALLATATGLVAAIPAVMIYNVFARAITGHRALIADASAAAMRLAGRDLDAGGRRLPLAAE